MRRCPGCGTDNLPANRFCGTCGAPLTPPTPASPATVGGTDAHPVVVEARPPSEPPPLQGDPLVGPVIADRYRILELIGRGGMGVVYRVEHVGMGKLMA